MRCDIMQLLFVLMYFRSAVASSTRSGGTFVAVGRLCQAQSPSSARQRSTVPRWMHHSELQPMRKQSLLFMYNNYHSFHQRHHSYRQQNEKQHQQHRSLFCNRSKVVLQAKPKSGSIVDTYRTVGVNCSKCRERLFRYKKKNGTKSNLVKCYIERIVIPSPTKNEDNGKEELTLIKQIKNINDRSLAGDKFLQGNYKWKCPSCQTEFARSSMIHGRPALKIVGGKIRMTKK